MAIFKCKMCGGDLEIAEGLSVAECEYCGTKQTVPKAMDENLQNLFNRANTLRIKSEFDKAEKIYEKIIQADATQSEAYWGLILCKYGIEYVDDPATFKKIPTCHRASYDSIIADDDYKAALENADMSQRAIYEEQAKEIDRIQKDILSLSQKEETYDVFICYKETDADGKRTQDSVIANDIYYQLKQEGFKVFYAAITLEGKLGSAYEPIIFAALNSAKVMLAIGTKPEYFNAVWVKNEWSRYLKIIKKDRSKLLIPCYRDMDAYELPEEFAHLQAQNMAKIGFINDLVRGIKKVAVNNEPKTTVKETVVVNNTANTEIAPLLKRASLFLEEKDWKSADEYCEKVLDIDPENSNAYFIKELIEKQCKDVDELAAFYCFNSVPVGKNLTYARRFANDEIKEKLSNFDAKLKNVDQIIEERRNFKLNDPSFQKMREKLETARKQMRLMEDRIKFNNTYHITVAIDDSSNICTTEMSEYSDEDDDRRNELSKWSNIAKIYSDFDGTIVGLTWDGTILFTQNAHGEISKNASTYKKMSRWRNIIQLEVSGLGWHGLTRFGKVLFAAKTDAEDEDRHGQDKVEHLTDIKKIWGDYRGRLVCIKKDGTLAATEFVNGTDESRWDEISAWTDIVDITCNVPGRIVGIKSDGTLVATKYINDDEDYSNAGDDKWDEISRWRDVIKLDLCGQARVIALDAYGDLLVSSKFSPDKGADIPYDPWEKISSWKELVDYYDDGDYAIGLKFDGTLVSEKWFDENDNTDYDYGHTDVTGWKNVVYFISGFDYTLAITKDGRVKILGDESHSKAEFDVSDFRLFYSINDFTKETENKEALAMKLSEEAEVEDVTSEETEDLLELENTEECVVSVKKPRDFENEEIEINGPLGSNTVYLYAKDFRMYRRSLTQRANYGVIPGVWIEVKYCDVKKVKIDGTHFTIFTKDVILDMDKIPSLTANSHQDLINLCDKMKERLVANKNTSVEYEISAGEIKASASSSRGCYVATCVYGSYDCPEVWTLRRFRDDTLGATWYGRLFIRTYYAISPTLVKWFGKTNWFKKMWQGKLDRMVKKLQDKGVESTPYEDKEW